MLYPAVADILQRGNNVVQPVYGIIIVERVFVCHCVKYAADCGEKPCAAFFVMIAHAFKHNAFFFKHCGYFFECERGVHANARGLVLFGKAGAYKNGFCIAVAALYVHAVRLHRRHHRRKAFGYFRIIFFYKRINGWATGGYNNALYAFPGYAFIFALNERCAYGGFFGISKAELLKPRPYGGNAYAVEIRSEGRGNACIYGRAGAEQNAHNLRFVRYLLCVLRADNVALAAQYAFVAYNVGLIAGKAN